MRDSRRYCRTSKAKLQSRLPTAAHPANNPLDPQMVAFRMGRADLTGKVVEEEATRADKNSDLLKFLAPRCKKFRNSGKWMIRYHACRSTGSRR
jgi:hypothetical protein